MEKFDFQHSRCLRSIVSTNAKWCGKKTSLSPNLNVFPSTSLSVSNTNSEFVVLFSCEHLQGIISVTSFLTVFSCFRKLACIFQNLPSIVLDVTNTVNAVKKSSWINYFSTKFNFIKCRIQF